MCSDTNLLQVNRNHQEMVIKQIKEEEGVRKKQEERPSTCGRKDKGKRNLEILL